MSTLICGHLISLNLPERDRAALEILACVSNIHPILRISLRRGMWSDEGRMLAEALSGRIDRRFVLAPLQPMLDRLLEMRKNHHVALPLIDEWCVDKESES